MSSARRHSAAAGAAAGAHALGEPRTPWGPERLVDAAGGPQEVGQLSYVVVEEAVDHLLVLQVWPWPRVDRQGRLFWALGEAPLELAVTRDLLHAQLYAPRLARAPRVGDAFAGRLSARDEPWSDPVVTDLRDAFPDGLFDVSAEAHQVAKLAYQGSLAAVPPPPPGQPEERVRLSGTLKHLRLAAPPARTAGP